VIGAYHQLWRIEKSFRMSKHDLRARPIYHHKRESIDAHLNVRVAPPPPTENRCRPVTSSRS
jgi:transposase